MNIIQISDTDLPGRRFNGYDLKLFLNQQGHQVYQFVMNKVSNDPNTIQLLTDRGLIIRTMLIDFEKRLCMNGLTYPYGEIMKGRQEFQKADIIHYHLIHNYFLSLLDLPLLTKLKPSVWTIHDPWAFTGHCVYPMDCEGWKTGCIPCPRLQDHFPMRYDKAGQMWKIKRQVYNEMDIDIIVSSKFMEDYVRNSPLTSHFKNIHRIPFGIRTEDFRRATRDNARKRWRIPDHHFVIAFRSEQNKYKGVKYILEMLKKLSSTKPITLITVGSEPLPSGLRKRFNVIELGWQNDLNTLYDFYAACDVFLMPSIAESFGLMAIEAMASARPVIVFEGTALPDVTFAPDCGIAVPYKNSDALRVAVERLINNPEECRYRGELGRKLAEQHYKFEDYVRRHIELYQEIFNRKRIR
ncbi:MAG: glycosyltransferase [Clostridiaceae bacterium]|nr:glycosyltransferase [Clostridiaceae bacterium]